MRLSVRLSVKRRPSILRYQMTTCNSHESIQDASELKICSALSLSIKTGVRELRAKMTTMEIRQESKSWAKSLRKVKIDTLQTIVGALKIRKMQASLPGCLRSTSRHDNRIFSARGPKIPACGSLRLPNTCRGEVAPTMFFGAMGSVSSLNLQQEALLNRSQLVRVRQY